VITKGAKNAKGLAKQVDVAWNALGSVKVTVLFASRDECAGRETVALFAPFVADHETNSAMEEGTISQANRRRRIYPTWKLDVERWTLFLRSHLLNVRP
jgi:hypothetical protein